MKKWKKIARRNVKLPSLNPKNLLNPFYISIKTYTNWSKSVNNAIKSRIHHNYQNIYHFVQNIKKNFFKWNKNGQKPIMELEEIEHYFPIGSKYLNRISMIFSNIIDRFTPGLWYFQSTFFFWINEQHFQEFLFLVGSPFDGRHQKSVASWVRKE